MTAQMVMCPHCGQENSAKKRICFHCHNELGASEPPAVATTTPAVNAEAVSSTIPTPTPRTRAPKAVRAKRRNKKAASSSALLGATLKQRVQFYRQMHGLLQAGIPLGMSLSHMERNMPFHLQPLMRRLATHTQGGALLSAEMANYPNIFAEWEISTILAAEKSGALPQAMQEVAEALEMEMNLKYRINASTFHLKATVVVFILVVLIVRSVQGAQGLSATVGQLEVAGAQFLVAIGAIFAAWVGWGMFGRLRTGANFQYRLLCSVPLFGPLQRNMMRLRFVRVLAALWHAGVAPMEALETAARATANAHFQHQITARMQQLSQGAQLSEIITPTALLTPEMIYLLQSGESSGTVSESLNHIAEYIKMELEAQVATLPAKIQLAFYAIIVPIIGYFIIAFYMGRLGPILGGS